MEAALVIPAIAGLIAWVAATFGSRRRAEAWRHAARMAGLTNLREKTTLGMLTEMRGEANGFPVTIEAYHRGKHEHGTRVVVDGRAQIPASLDLRAEGFGTTLDRTFGGKEIEVGDPGFDQEVYAQGPEDVLLPLLDAPTRSLVRATVGRRGRIADSAVRVELRGTVARDLLAITLNESLATARALRPPEEAVQRLVDIANQDPFPGVQLRSIELLRLRHSDHERARAAFKRALGSPDVAVRLAAATALGADGRPTLIEIAGATAAEEGPVTQAIAALGAMLPVDHAVRILDQAIAARRDTVASATVQALALIGGQTAVGALAQLLARGTTALTVAAARALGSLADPGAQPALITALASDESDLRTAAAESLGQLGTTAAVAPLHAAVEDHLLDLGLRSAARQAIAAIQSRAPGASPGQISLTQGDAGQLSLSAGEAGQVSLPER